LLLLRPGTIRFIAHAQWAVQMAWYGDVRFEKLAVTEFLVTEKESVTHINKRLKCMFRVSAVDKSTVSRWASRIASSGKVQTELSDTRRLAGQQHQSLALLQCAEKLIRNDRRFTTRKVAAELSVCKGSVNLGILKILCSLLSSKSS
jgi:hypothetical protein